MPKLRYLEPGDPCKHGHTDWWVTRTYFSTTRQRFYTENICMECRRISSTESSRRRRARLRDEYVPVPVRGILPLHELVCRYKHVGRYTSGTRITATGRKYRAIYCMECKRIRDAASRQSRRA